MAGQLQFRLTSCNVGCLAAAETTVANIWWRHWIPIAQNEVGTIISPRSLSSDLVIPIDEGSRSSTFSISVHFIVDGDKKDWQV
jgi:hypothetical protein